MKDRINTLPHYVEHLQSQGKYCFVRSDAKAFLHMTDNAFKKSAHRLIQKGRVHRIRDDFYTLIPIEYKASGFLPAPWFIDEFMRHIGQPYYCGLLTAAALLGVAHQQPMVFQVLTTKQMRPIEINQLRIEFVNKKIIQPCFYKSVKTTTGYMNVSTPEITAFDLVRYMRVAGHIHHVATVLCELVSQLNSQQLANHVEKGDVSVTDAQRLGYLLDSLNLSIDLQPLELILKSKRPNRRLLVTGDNYPILERNCRWKILVNEHVEPDEL